METFEYTLPAVRGVQAGREYFVTMCPMDLVQRLFMSNDDTLKPELRVQRVLNPGRVPEIAAYVGGHSKSYVLPALTAAVDRDVRFKPLNTPKGPASAGTLHIPMTAKLLLHDGLHRCAAIESILKQRPELADETLSVVLYVDPGFLRAEQVYTDLKRHETRSARSLSILFDHRDENARLVRACVARVPVFASLTEMARSKISNRSLKLFTLSGIYHATTTLLADRQDDPFTERLQAATEFWMEVAANMSDWRAAAEAEVSPAELRKNFVHSHAIALAALARAGRTMLLHRDKGWRKKLKQLQSLDWSRSNARLWEGRAMIAGRLSKANTCVTLAGNAIKMHLQVPLTDDEQEVERRFKQRRRSSL